MSKQNRQERERVIREFINDPTRERAPDGAANEPPPSAVKQCGATERRLRNGDRRGLPFAFRRPRCTVPASPDSARPSQKGCAAEVARL